MSIPTLTTFLGPIDTTYVDAVVEITLAELKAQGNESDDGSVDAFNVKAVSSGTLRIGSDALTATAYDSSTNFTIDSTHKAYWTPESGSYGSINVFTVVAVDNLGAESLTPVQTVVNFYTSTFSPKADYSSYSSAASVASADINVDGYLDLVTTNAGSATVSVLLNNGDGTFSGSTSYDTGTSPFSVVTVDLNGDHKLDLAVANFGSNNVSVLLNNGDGTFAARVDYPSGASLLSSTPISVSSSDFNNDGYTDLVVANLVGASVSVLMNDKSGGFSSKIDYTTGSYPYSVTSADVNGDGKADVITANYGDSTVSVLLNTGDGTLAGKVDFVTKNGANAVTTADVNGDGKIDVITANYDSSSVSVLLNTTSAGTLGFASHVDYDTGSGAASVSVADFNGDGKVDLVVSNNIGNTLSVLLNNGDGTFASKIDYSSGANPYAAIGADLNGDGRPDIISANYGDSSVSVFLNNMTNNNAPVLTVANATVNLAENALAGEVSGADANATDADTNNAVTFSLVSPPLNGSSEPLFSIDYLTGQVSLTAAGQTAIDYESSTKSYILTVKASDGLAAHDQTATITVNLTNVNDNAPVFTSGTTGAVNENATASTVIYTASSTDADGPSPAATYTLGGTDASVLNINTTTGEVTLLASADYETKASYNFNVIASDGVNTSTQGVVVSVNNLNDNAPTFTSGTTGAVNENAATSTVIYTATTTDADGPSPAATYTLGGTDSGLLNINTTTGE
ncbi:MAG: FG-GAP-like repeat-containing protein, partial [Chlorobium sp.]